jgi:putative transposase
MAAAEQLAPSLGLSPACQALGVSRATLYRRRRRPTPPTPADPRPNSPRALSTQERQIVLDTLHSERFVDQAPAEVYATLLDQQTYLCSIRTMYRILEHAAEVRERRDQLRHPQYHKPQLVATAPNRVWTWDITRLLGPARGRYFYLYTILDLFSRYATGWLLAHRECAELAQRFIRETCDKHGIVAGELTLHSDRGAPMTSQSVAQLLASLGVDKSHSRPHVSDDNPFSESQFKTMKYRPEFPDRFDSHEHAHGFCHGFFDWYNNRHHHSALGLLTPAMVHYGQASQVLALRQQALTSAYSAHPERFVLGPPRPQQPPQAVWINRPTPQVNGTREQEPVTPLTPQRTLH